MKIEQVKIKNYKVFKDVVIKNLPNMCVFLGANGSGKSTLFDIFGFLSDSLKNNVKTAINRRGGFKEVVSREQGGDIEFEIKFRNEPVDGRKQPLITYELSIGVKDKQPIITSEKLSYRRGRTGTPYKFLNFSKGKGVAIANEEEYEETKQEFKGQREDQVLDAPDILAIKGLGQFQRFRAISSFRRLLENWYISNFSINEARMTQDVGISEHLTTSGDNLALVAQYIYQNHQDIFAKILERMKKRVPGVSDIKAAETVDGRIVLQFRDGTFKDPFIARYVSDGTLKMFAYLILLHSPKPYPLFCIEEPENYLHPSLLKELTEEFREYALRGGQVFISTHSPDFINGLKINELFWLTKEKGFTRVFKASEDELVKSLYDEGDQLGYLWMQRFLKGSGPE